MNKKEILILTIVAILFITATSFIYIAKTNPSLTLTDTTSEEYLFYKNLDEKFKDCGSEELAHGEGYNEKMRECFNDMYKSCTLSKIHQKLVTIEGDPIFTTVVIEGEKENGCLAHVYVSSFDNYGKRGKYNTQCYSAKIDTSTGQKSLIFDDCSGGTKHLLY